MYTTWSVFELVDSSVNRAHDSIYLPPPFPPTVFIIIFYAKSLEKKLTLFYEKSFSLTFELLLKCILLLWYRSCAHILTLFDDTVSNLCMTTARESKYLKPRKWNDVFLMIVPVDNEEEKNNSIPISSKFFFGTEDVPQRTFRKSFIFLLCFGFYITRSVVNFQFRAFIMISIRRDETFWLFYPHNNAFQIIIHIENKVQHLNCLISDLPLYYIYRRALLVYSFEYIYIYVL